MPEKLGPIETKIVDVRAVAGDSPEVLKAKLAAIVADVYKSEADFTHLGANLKSPEAVNYVGAESAKIAAYLGEVAEKGRLIKKDKKEATEADCQPLNVLKAKLNSELAVIKSEFENFRKIEAAGADLDGELAQSEKAVDDNAEMVLDERLTKYDNLYRGLATLKAWLPTNVVAEAGALLQTLNSKIDAVSVRLAYKVTDLNIAKRCQDQKFKDYFKVDKQGNITYTDSFAKLKESNPKAFEKIKRQITEAVTGTDFVALKDKIAALGPKIEAFDQAVKAYETDPSDQNKQKVLEARPPFEIMQIPTNQERAGIKSGPVLSDFYADASEAGTLYNEMKARFDFVNKRFENKDEEVNDGAAKDVLDGLAKSWQEKLAPKTKEYQAFSSKDLPRLTNLLALDPILLTPQNKAESQSLKAGHSALSEEVLRGVLMMRNIAETFANKKNRL